MYAWSATKCALLADQTASTSGEEHVASPPKVSKVSKAKEIPMHFMNEVCSGKEAGTITRHSKQCDTAWCWPCWGSWDMCHAEPFMWCLFAWPPGAPMK